MSIVLRDYQIDVTNRARARFAEGFRRGILQGSTGCGKTTCSSHIVRCAVEKKKKVLFLAHMRRLVQQKSERLKEFGIEHGVIMARESPRSAPVQVASKDTLVSRAIDNEWIGFPPADLVIVDECRHSMSAEYQKLLKFYENAFVLGLDATPTTSDGKGLGAYYQFLECTVPTSQLVREGYLVSIRAYCPERAGSARKRGDKVKGLAGDPVSNWLRWGEDRPTVLFASRIESSQAACKAFTDAGIAAEHLDSNNSDEEREAVVERVRAGKTKIVCQCSLWTEGVDIPELSCCILLRMAKSAVLFFQAVGRIMRPHPSKKDGILIDHAGAIQEHGFPDEDAEWTLDPGDSVDRRIKDAKVAGKRKEPIVCPKCSFIFSGSIKCPGCGHTLAKRHQPVETRDELLVEVERGIAPMRDRENRVRLWKQALAQAYHMGRSYKVARVMFKQKTGEWPGEDFPHGDFDRSEWDQKVRDLMPDYTRRKSVV